jgi:ribose 5-phosphate isomerase B
MIYIASDHGGFKTKIKLVKFLQKKGYKITDFGPTTFNPEDDYPDYVIPLAKQVSKTKNFGIVICRNGQGVCIATNKVKGVRAVTGFSKKEAITTRKDDNANILCIPADYLTFLQITTIATNWLKTEFSGAQRHKRRLRKISKIENGFTK